MKTVVVNQNGIKHEWFVIDASEAPIGRLSSTIARLLIGKGKVAYSPNQDHGDFIVVINADKAYLTGKKADMKTYFSHSTQPGKAKYRPFKKQMEMDSTQVIRHSVWGMLPKGPLGRAIYKKLHVYKDASHPHSAQKPQKFALTQGK
jgi:large subunit ribosomal protein L13